MNAQSFEGLEIAVSPKHTGNPVDWLLPLDSHWPAAVCRHLERGEPVVRVLVAEMRGSAPREPGACMLIGRDGIEGTIGGGNLEQQALRAARELLFADAAAQPARVERFVLGRELGQCCGGVVQLWLERFTATDLQLMQSAAGAVSEGSEAGASALVTTELVGSTVHRTLHQVESSEPRVRLARASDGSATLLERIDHAAQRLWLYGAGHVGQAIVRSLAGLPFQITWIDSRGELMPSPVPDNVQTILTPEPLSTINRVPKGAYCLVLTHDHALDYALCRAMLMRRDFAWLGLIGSESKGARFRSRLRRDGLAPETIARLVCPIGVNGIDSKLPAAIAISVAAQLLQLSSAKPAAATISRSLPVQVCADGDCVSCRNAQRSDR